MTKDIEQPQLKNLSAEWKKLSAPEIVDEINSLRVLFAEEEKRLRKKDPNRPVFNSDVSYYKPLNVLFEELNIRLLSGEEITLHYNVYTEPEGPVSGVTDIIVLPKTVQFTSDKDGNYIFDGNVILVEQSSEWSYKLLKKKILTVYSRPVDFYLKFLDAKSKYTPDRNIFVDMCKVICEKYRRK